MNKVVVQQTKGTTTQSNRHGNQNQVGKVGPMDYHCLICESPNHKIYGFPHKQVA